MKCGEVMEPLHLIVVVVFDKDDAGSLFPVGELQQFENEERAVRAGKDLVSRHDGVIAWSRQAHPDIGEYGPPKILYQAGEAINME
jgi:hypothetical protein